MPKNPHADFSPVLDGYSGIGAFRFWCQTALPLTYDDSLSYYELLNKVVNYLNHTIEDLTAVESNTSALANAYDQLQKYVNDYFDDLDVEAELRNVLDAMAEDGTLDALLNPLVENQLPGIVDEKIDGVVADQIDGAVAGQIDESVADQLPALVEAGIPEEVTDWLEENVDPVGSAVVVDSSLTISGAAADAKVTGDEINELKTNFNSVTVSAGTGEVLDTRNNLATSLSRGYYTTQNGVMVLNNNASFSNMKFNVTPGTKYQINKTHNIYSLTDFPALGCFVDSNGDFISTINTVLDALPASEPYDVVAPNNAAQLYLNTDYAYTYSPVQTTVYAYVEGTVYELDSSKLNNQPVYPADIEPLEEGVERSNKAMEDTLVGGSGYELDTSVNYATSLHRGYYTTRDGAISFNNNANFSYMVINVTPGEKYQINKTHNVYTFEQFASIGVFADSNTQLVTDIATQAGHPAVEPYDVTVPVGATKMLLNTDYAYTATNVQTTVYKYNVVSVYKVSDDALETPPVYYEDISDNKKVKIIAGVIRNSGEGWEFIDNNGHEPLNLTSVSVDENGYIVINYGFTASKVLSLVVCPDEAFAGQYTCGASVGLNNSVIKIYSLPKSIGGMVRYTSGAWTYATTSDFTGVTFESNGNLTLSHDDLTGYPMADIYSVSADGFGCNVQINSVGYSSVIVKLIDASGNTITSPVNNTTVYVTRHLNRKLMDANDVVNAIGNFWIYGIMEVD